MSHNIVQLGTQQEILFDQVHLNAGNGYDVRHGNFRAPVDGTYEFSVSMLSPGGKWAGVEIVKVKCDGEVNLYFNLDVLAAFELKFKKLPQLMVFRRIFLCGGR